MSSKSRNAKKKDFRDRRVKTDFGLELQTLLDAFPFYVMLLDEDHKILLANKAIKSDLDLDPEQIGGEPCPKIVHGLEEPYPGCPLEEAIERGHSVEREFFDPEGNRWIDSVIYRTKQRTPDGKEIYVHL
jgi:PAS domain-containing protein